MNVTIAMLTYNRCELFKRALSSLKWSAHRYELVIVDNGSTDGTLEILPNYTIRNDSGDHSVGYGMNLAINAALETCPDLIVFTADDYEYKKGWLARLVSFWENKPADTVLGCCNLEPDYNWNAVYSHGVAGGEPYVMRESIPGSNWVFEPSATAHFMPIPHITGGEDLAVCRHIRGMGKHLAALDLSDHIGERSSAWGNQSWTVARSLNKAQYGFIE